MASIKITRLYVSGKVLGYRRSRHNQRCHTSLLSINDVNNKKDALFYQGKRVAYIYKANELRKGSNVRVIWGKISRPHGNTGAVRAKFKRNLPTYSFGKTIRIVYILNL